MAKWLGFVSLLLSTIGWFGCYRIQTGNFSMHEASKNTGLEWVFLQVIAFPAAALVCAIGVVLLSGTRSRNRFDWGVNAVAALAVLPAICIIIFFVGMYVFRFQ